MKAKQVFEALSDILKPPSESTISTKFQEILGDPLALWIQNIPFKYNIEDYSEIHIEISIMGHQNEPYYFFIRGNHDSIFSEHNKNIIKVTPPHSMIYSKGMKIDNKEEFYEYIDKWISGKLKDTEKELKAISDYNFPED